MTTAHQSLIRATEVKSTITQELENWIRRIFSNTDVSMSDKDISTRLVVDGPHCSSSLQYTALVLRLAQWQRTYIDVNPYHIAVSH